jgi:hypothetical protein
MMFVAVWVASIVFGMALGVLLMLFIVPIVLLAMAGQLIGAVGLGVLAGLVAMLPGAIYGTFQSAAWTIFFRRMTGREVVATAVTPAPEVPYRAPSEPAPPAPAAYYDPTPGAGSGDAGPAPEPLPADPWQAANDLPDAGSPVGFPEPPSPPADGGAPPEGA